MLTVGIEEAVEQLVTAFGALHHPSEAFFFLVGAGLSTPEVPLSGAIEDECRRRTATARTPQDASDANASGMERYSFWLRHAFPQPIERQRYYRELIEGKPISLANLRLAHLLLSGKVPTLVVTPNFDDFLSRALTLFGKPHVLCDHPATAQRIDPERADDIQILHVHGTYWFYDLKNLPGEIGQRARDDVAHQTIASRLDMILTNRSPLVLGYSGWEEDVFMTALQRRLSAYPLKYNLYWFCYRREELSSLPRSLKDRDDVIFVLPRDEDASDERETFAESVAQKEGSAGTAAAVFDALIRRFGIAAPPLTHNPVLFYASQLRASLPPVAPDAGSPDDFYGITSVIERLEALGGGWDAEPSPSLGAQEVSLEPVRDALRRSQYREAVSMLRALSLDDLTDDQLAEVGDAGWLAATGLLDNSDEELAAYDVVIAGSDSLRARGHAPSRKLVEQTVGALLNKAITVQRRGRSEEELAIYDEILRRFGDDPDPRTRLPVAMALVNRAFRLGVLERYEEEIAAYEKVIDRFADDPDPQLRLPVARALVNRAFRLGVLERYDEEIAAYEKVIDRFADDPDPQLRLPVAQALFNKGFRLGVLERYDEEIAAYQKVIDRFADDPDPKLRLQAAKALFNKGVTLGQLDRGGEAIGAYDEVVRRFDGDHDLPMREQVAQAFVNKSHALHALGRLTEALGACDEVLRRFDSDEEPSLSGIVATAMANKSEALNDLGRSDEALAVADAMFQRFRRMENLEIRNAYADALLNKGDALRALSRPTEAREAYEQVRTKFSSDPDPSLVASVQRATDRLAQL